jgi:kynurenine formamidase
MTAPASGPIPTEAEVLGYAASLSNWGRWGPDDQLGTLNLITPEVRLAAIRTVQFGITVGCARAIATEPPVADVRFPPLHLMAHSGDAPAETSASEFIAMMPHGLTISHVDALSHRFSQGKLYNGYPQDRVSTGAGATVCSVETMKDGVVTRGLLFDIPRHRGVRYLEGGDPVLPQELDDIAEQMGEKIRPGDALLLRTGWALRRAELGPDARQARFRPGLHAACLPWLYERGVAVCASDAAHDVAPSGYENIRLPIHDIAIPHIGLCLIDACQFEDLSATCRGLGRWSFLFVMAPLRLSCATASPVTPLGIF